MEWLSPWHPGLAGVIVGAAVGYTARRGRLCTFGAIEDALVGSDRRRIKTFGLALGIAIVATQALILTGGFDPRQTGYVSSLFPWLAVFSGSLLFGIGMALVGTCAFGCLVRLGGGDLRSLVTLLVFGAVAYSTLRGVASGVRIDLLESWTVPVPGGVGDLPGVLGIAPGSWLRAVPAAVIGGGLVLLALADRRLGRSRRLLTGGGVLGLGVAAGWLSTGVFIDPFDGPARAQSLTFVGPVAKLLYGLLAGAAELSDFAVASCGGVVAGSAAAALRADEARWEAFDDHHEMRRHLVGAVLMGFGGTVGGGCTIGQGVSAGSLLALSAPLAMLGMLAGAALGIAFLMEGSVRGVLARFSPRWAGRRLSG